MSRDPTVRRCVAFGLAAPLLLVTFNATTLLPFTLASASASALASSASSGSAQMPAFPDASTTGWRHTGVVLTPSAGLTVRQDGAVIDGLDVTGNIDIKANNVTVKRSRITSNVWYPIRVYGGFTGFQLIDSEVSGVGSTAVLNCAVGVNGTGITLTRVDIHDCADGVHPGGGSTIQDSYIHNLWLGTDASGVRVLLTHNDGIQLLGPGNNYTILHNRIETGHNQNAAVFVKADFGAISNVNIANNYLDGGSYTLFGGDTTAWTVTNVSVTGNTFGPSQLYGQLFTERMTGPTRMAWNVNAAGRRIDKDPVLVAAGDIACDPADPAFGGERPGLCAASKTALAAAGLQPDIVAVLGDTQRAAASISAFRSSYDTTWGRFLSITRPAAGDVEYGTRAAGGYFKYFGQRAGSRSKGYYSYDIGAWHVVVLNSQCEQVGGCDAHSPQVSWLKRDLAAHPALCTLAYWHDPRFSSSAAESMTQPFWNVLTRARVDVVLNAHDNAYERFIRLNAAGRFDPNGIREFVVGTGGTTHGVAARPARGSVVRSITTFGVLGLTLHPTGYDWKFVAAGAGTFTDSGSAGCR